MEVQLRPPRAHWHPLYRPASRRRGMGATYTPLDCTTDLIAGGNAEACVAENTRRQAQYMLDDYNERLAAFIAACNRDWQLNDDQYKALGLPRPVNNCAERTYGLTAPGGTTGGQVQAQIPVTYMPPPPPAAAAPAPAPAPIPAAVQASARTPITETYIAPAPQAIQISHRDATAGEWIEGSGIPVWGLVLAGAAVLYFMRGK